MEEQAAEALVQQRGFEAELKHEVHGLVQTLDVLKKKNAALPIPDEERTQKIEALASSVATLEQELIRSESQHDEVIAEQLSHMTKSSESLNLGRKGSGSSRDGQ
ncbi:hypothetical protein PhCBS80983_g00493 [Powellomyces hirtus]|uniref:Uncharacterized protein n=1 Tax=Powellomyces hirtus TaxID=109895 RepID=A0A507EEQ5_9FUNG|nr:hypothetical protein PhCBS80983_g00493 [Powellomyces hirtus]